MTILDCVTIFVRVAAVLFSVFLIQYVPATYSYMFYGDGLEATYTIWLQVIALSLLCLILWVLPKTVALIVTPKDLRQKDVGKLNAGEIELASLSVIGLWLLIWSVPDAFHNTYVILRSPQGTPDQIAAIGYLLTTLVEAGLGLFLVVKSRGIYELIQKLRS